MGRPGRGYTQAALDLRREFRFAAPELLIPECANILWKKVRRGELLRDEAVMASKLLERSGIEVLSMAGLLERATTLAIELSHPAYDCIYLAAAHQKRVRFVTADRRLLRIVARAAGELAGLCFSLSDLQISSQ